MTDLGLCPRCDEHQMMHPPQINALSRLSRHPGDPSIWVCSDCGTDEALEQVSCKQVTPKRDWPLPFRTFDAVICSMKIQQMILSKDPNSRETDETI